MHTRNPGYQPGNHWMMCSVCGFDYRFSEMRKRWDGLWVCPKDYEQRHPQDYVRGRIDRQRVPVARPAPVIGNLTTTLSSAASKDAKSIVVASVSDISEDDSIGIVLQTFTESWGTSELIQWTFVTDVTGTTLSLNDRLWEDAESGNKVYLSKITGPEFITTAVTVEDL